MSPSGARVVMPSAAYLIGRRPDDAIGPAKMRAARATLVPPPITSRYGPQRPDFISCCLIAVMSTPRRGAENLPAVPSKALRQPYAYLRDAGVKYYASPRPINFAAEADNNISMRHCSR